MVILGLGSNIGNRYQNLKAAVQLLTKDILSNHAVSFVYEIPALLPKGAPKDWDQNYLNMAIAGETSLRPLDLLEAIKKIEQNLKRRPAEKWAPRVIDIDILSWEQNVIQEEYLHVPHKELLKRPFALLPLTDLAPFWKYPCPGDHYQKTAEEITLKKKFTRSGLKRFHFKPEIIGILNITPDSFSHDKPFNDLSDFIDHFHYLVDSGAQIIDIGAESTRPGAQLLTVEQEWQRLFPILETIKSLKGSQKSLQHIEISLDTRHPEILKRALPFGVGWLNDVTGLQNNDFIPLLKTHPGLKVVLMHSLGAPADPDNIIDYDHSPVNHIKSWAEKKIKTLRKQGVSNQLILDPGIGFGKTPFQSLSILKNLDALKSLKCEILLGHSRKSFTKLFSDLPAKEKDLETNFFSGYSYHSVDYVRVHNVSDSRRVLNACAGINSFL